MLSRAISNNDMLAAVKQNGKALQYVKEQTPEICLAALDEQKKAKYLAEKSRSYEILRTGNVARKLFTSNNDEAASPATSVVINQ